MVEEALVFAHNRPTVPRAETMAANRTVSVVTGSDD